MLKRQCGWINYFEKYTEADAVRIYILECGAICHNTMFLNTESLLVRSGNCLGNKIVFWQVFNQVRILWVKEYYSDLKWVKLT